MAVLDPACKTAYKNFWFAAAVFFGCFLGLFFLDLYGAVLSLCVLYVLQKGVALINAFII